MRKQIGDLLSRFGFRLGSESGTELKGSRPYPPIEVMGLDYEWDVGLEWYLKRIKGKTILDAGFIAHKEFSKLLARLGFEVYGIDIGEFAEEIENLSVIRRPIWDTSLEEKSVDTIIANSLLEHLGLPCYGQDVIEEGDEAAIEEFRRILHPTGLLLLQVPFGKTEKIITNEGVPFYKVYTSEGLDKLLQAFGSRTPTFYTKTKKGWIEVNKNIADKIEQGGGFPSCLVYLEVKGHE